jgi:cold shock protein
MVRPLREVLQTLDGQVFTSLWTIRAKTAHRTKHINYLADDDAIDNRSGLQPDARGREMVELSSAHAVLSSLNEGQVIEYEIVENRGKQSAENLKVSR